MNMRAILLYALTLGLILGVGFVQSWNLALTILNMGLVSAIMALGLNMQWGYAGLFNVGVMGFVALGGLGTVLVSAQPVPEAWSAGGLRALLAMGIGAGVIAAAIQLYRRMGPGLARSLALAALIVAGFVIYRMVRDPAVDAIEAVNPAATGYLGGLGLPVLIAWPVGGLLAAGAAWIVAKTALGLRSDYLAIATLGISEIIIAILKNEDWLTRGVKNVTALPRPVPYEVDLRESPGIVEQATSLGMPVDEFAGIVVKLAYAGLFLAVLAIVLLLAERALKSPWGRMMRAIRDNETAAEAMGKDVKARHLQIFVIGAFVIGMAGAMMTTLDSQLTPTSYQPLRYTFLIWVMLIVGGSGNNWGAVLGGILIWFFWVEVEPIGLWLMDTITAGMAEDSALRAHLLDSAAHMRLLTMGLILLLVLRFSPRGLLPER